MNIVISANGFSQHERLLKERLLERLPVEFTEGGMIINLLIDSAIDVAESYRIDKTENGFSIIGSDTLGLYYGVGNFLHSAKWETDAFFPVATDGIVSPASSYRAIYFSAHFYNWYQMCDYADLERYMEDLLLWGYNTIHACFPVVNIYSFEDEASLRTSENLRAIFILAKKIGMKTSMVFGNQGLLGMPSEYDADLSFSQFWRGNEPGKVCVSKPAALDYLRGVWRKQLEIFADIGLDYIMAWPYDEGGCGCKDCTPWGANGYCKMCLALREEVLRLYPNAEFVVSTWTFDFPELGEYEGMYRRLDGGDMAWVDYLMVDAHEGYPPYVLEHDIVKPVVNFPEISMYGLFPWGGFGAVPLPERFQKFWDASKKVLSGGMPYSEGLYEDISKIQFIGYYWNPNKHYREILGEYANYEYGYRFVDQAVELMRLIEINHKRVAEYTEPDFEVAKKALNIANYINDNMSERAKNAWRWRILYIRAVLDYKRYEGYFLLTDSKKDTKIKSQFRHFSDRVLLNDKEAQDMLRELQMLYCSVPYTKDRGNAHTLPPLGGSPLYPQSALGDDFSMEEFNE